MNCEFVAGTVTFTGLQTWAHIRGALCNVYCFNRCAACSTGIGNVWLEDIVVAVLYTVTLYEKKFWTSTEMKKIIFFAIYVLIVRDDLNSKSYGTIEYKKGRNGFIWDTGNDTVAFLCITPFSTSGCLSGMIHAIEAVLASNNKTQAKNGGFQLWYIANTMWLVVW